MRQSILKRTVLCIFLSIELNFCLSQYVTRFTNDFDTDEFPNPNAACSRQGCANSNAYKFCVSCCNCRCNYGSYWSASKQCLADFEIAKDCKFVLGSGSDPNTVAKTSSTGLQSGLDIFYCPNTWSTCSTKATKCSIQRATTFYENTGWKILWTKNGDIDMNIVKSNAGTDKLQRTSAICSSKMYDGLLISLGITCNVGNSRVNSCLAFKMAGSYRIGANPLERTNCTVSTTATTTRTLETTKTTTTTAKTTAAASTTKPATTTQTSVPTTIVESTADSTSKSSTRATTKSVSFSSSARPKTTAHSDSTSMTTHQQGTETNATRTTATTIHSKTIRRTTVPSNSSGTGDLGNRESKPSNTGKVIAIAVSLSIAAVLLIIIIIILLTCYVKGRRVHNYQQHHDNRKIILNISNPQPLNPAAPLPPGTQGHPSGVLWTINPSGDFVAIDSAPVFTICRKGEHANVDDYDDDDYDEPITRRTSSLGKLYAVVKKHKRSSQKEKDDGYSSIGDIPLSIAAKNASLKDEKDGRPTLPNVIKSSMDRGSPPRILLNGNCDPVYDVPEEMNHKTQEDGNADGNGHIYAIYEPTEDHDGLLSWPRSGT